MTVVSDGRQPRRLLAPTRVIGVLPVCDLTVCCRAIARDALRPLHERPALTGALVFDGPHLLGIISRGNLLETMSKPLWRDVFQHRTVRELFNSINRPHFCLPADTEIPHAAHRALAREHPLLYEPLVVEFSDGQHRLLDIRVLLHAQTQLLAEQVEILQLTDQQLRQAQKLKAVGSLASGIAHEINTPLQYVGDNTRFLQDAFSDLRRVIERCGLLLGAAQENRLTSELILDAEQAFRAVDLEYLAVEIPQAIEQSLDGVEQVSQIVRSMQEFSGSACGKVPVDLNRAIEATLTASRHEWRKVAQVATQLDDSLPLVDCVAGEINQVLLNLITNAAHAIAEKLGNAGEKGRICVSTHYDEAHAEVRVSDTGTGIPVPYRSRIFDRFFTTKDMSQGRGQGLATAYHVIVETHGGEINFQTELGQGTTFVLRLPFSRSDAEPVTEPLFDSAAEADPSLTLSQCPAMAGS